MLQRDATWETQHDPKLLGGVTVLKTEAVAAPGSEPADTLFQRVPTGAPKPLNLMLIPYYAWNNRAETEMTVWLPLR